MRRDLWQKRIPTLLGIFLIVVGILSTSFLTRTGVNLIGKATPLETPQNVRMTNLSENSFTVSYTTETAMVGSLNFGQDKNLNKNTLDDQDQQSGVITSRKLHHLTVRNLEPETKYYFTILSGQTTFYSSVTEEKPFEITTGPVIDEDLPSQLPLTGKVVTPDGNKPNEAIVYLSAKDSQILSTLLKADGTYLLPLNSLRREDLKKFYSFSKEVPFHLLVLGDKTQSEVSLLSSQVNPVPLITLSQNYDFTVAETPSSTSSAFASPSAKFLGFPSFPAAPGKDKSKEPKVVVPKENEGFTDTQPLFKGTASPGGEVKIMIQSEEGIKTEVKADRNGNWSFRPPNNLSPGQHIISISTKDQFGILKTITRSFTVYASGTQVNQSATPSATPTLVISPTPMASATPTVLPSPTPTLTPEPTALLTQKPPASPGNSFLETTTILASSLVLLGLFILLLSHGRLSL